MAIKDGDRVLFSDAELRCKGTGTLRLAPGFGELLKELRLAYDKPMVVNSCCRAPSHNKKVGGHPNSLHLTEGGRDTGGTCAIDISTRGMAPGDDAMLASLALQRGWSVGVHPAFLHFDMRTVFADLPQNIFNY